MRNNLFTPNIYQVILPDNHY